MKDKNFSSVVEQLYKDGIITFEKAVEMMTLEKNSEQRNETKEDKMEKFIHESIYGHPDDSEYDNGIDVDHCYEVMTSMNWEVYDMNEGKKVPVTKKIIVDTIKDLCRRCITKTIEKYNNDTVHNSYENYETTIETIGFRVYTYIDVFTENDETNEYLDMTIEFIPEASYNSITLEGLGEK